MPSQGIKKNTATHRQGFQHPLGKVSEKMPNQGVQKNWPELGRDSKTAPLLFIYGSNQAGGEEAQKVGFFTDFSLFSWHDNIYFEAADGFYPTNTPKAPI